MAALLLNFRKTNHRVMKNESLPIFSSESLYKTSPHLLHNLYVAMAFYNALKAKFEKIFTKFSR